MIKAVFFDLYHTLVHYEPPREELLAKALNELGVGLKPTDLSRPLVIADEFLYAEQQEEMDLKVHYIVKRARTENIDNKAIGKKQTLSTGTLTSPFGIEDIHEGIRRKCVASIHPARTLDFERCRNERFASGQTEEAWRVCAEELGLDVAELTDCIIGGRGAALLDREIEWIEAIGGSVNPSYLINNQVLLRGIKPETALQVFGIMNP